MFWAATSALHPETQSYILFLSSGLHPNTRLSVKIDAKSLKRAHTYVGHVIAALALRPCRQPPTGCDIANMSVELKYHASEPIHTTSPVIDADIHCRDRRCVLCSCPMTSGQQGEKEKWWGRLSLHAINVMMQLWVTRDSTIPHVLTAQLALTGLYAEDSLVVLWWDIGKGGLRFRQLGRDVCERRISFKIMKHGVGIHSCMVQERLFHSPGTKQTSHFVVVVVQSTSRPFACRS